MDKELHNEMNDSMKGQFLPMFSLTGGTGIEVIPGIYCYTNQIVNVVCVDTDKELNEWVLIDAGMPESFEDILAMVEKRYGDGSKPEAIILTHGHFDHVGAVVDLVEKWNVKVYAHERELPFLTGQQSYPEPDGSVEGGLVAKMSPMFPVQPVDLGDHVEAIHQDGSVPYMDDWRWIHTPGHSPGHISLFRESDRTLIAGDAFVTVEQESLYKVITQTKEINGPPRYLTTDWIKAKASVQNLADLKPNVAITGHGHPMGGKELEDGLSKLADAFDDIAVPDYGRYVGPEH